jgi:hypothetical protein
MLDLAVEHIRGLQSELQVIIIYVRTCVRVHVYVCRNIRTLMPFLERVH